MFNFFKKRKKEQAETAQEHSIVLCIPTTCQSNEELITEIVKNSQGEYLYAGMVLMHVKSSKHYMLEVTDHDPKMKEAFAVAGKPNQVSQDFLNTIEAHQTVVYISGKSGSFENAFAIAKAANAILKSGGLGVKVESSGKAFTKEQWLTASEEYDEVSLYDLFVVETIYDQNTELTYSCGMHNIGYKDVAVRNENFDTAYELIRMFNIFRFVDKPVLNEGETFSLSADSDRYVISELHPSPTEGQALFENQFGFWELVKK